jgi:hypothetical protein
LNQISSKNMDMENREHIKKEIEKEAPFLSRLEKENIFQVPENYFSDLPDNIHARIYRKKSSIVLPGFLLTSTLLKIRIHKILIMLYI